MFDLDKWQEVFSTLRRNKLRTLMTACGIFWGIFAMVLMLGFGNGLRLGVTRNMDGFVTNSVYVWGQRTSKPYKGLAPGRWVRFKKEDIAAILRQVPQIKALAPRIQLGGWRDGNVVTYGTHQGNFGVMGDYPGVNQVESIVPSRGRLINDLDIARNRKVTVIGAQVARILFGQQNPIGKYVKIRGVHFQVVGVHRSDRPGEEGDRNNNMLMIPFTTFQAAFSAHNDVGWFGMVAHAHVSAEEMERAVREVLYRQHTIHPDDENALGSYNAAKAFNKVQTLFTGVRFFVWFVSMATLFAGVLGVSNIMLISVKERTKEIGVRKALGATPLSVVSLVVQEAAVLTALAGYVGLVVGVLALELTAASLTGEGPLGAPSIDLTTALIAAVVLFVAGLIAGIAPAQHAARIQPVQALRDE